MKKTILKKFFATLTVSALIIAALPVSALAKGHNSSQETSHGSNHNYSQSSHKTSSSKSSTTKKNWCTVASCNSTGTHTHNGKSYSSHTKNDGHTNHTINADGVYHN